MHRINFSHIVTILALVLLTLSPSTTQAQPGTVLDAQKISNTQGNFLGTLNDSDRFGQDTAPLGDLDGDGITDIVTGAYLDNDGGTDRGAVWILFLNANGTVKSHQKISDTQGGFTGVLDNSDQFGISVTNLGDLDGDNITDIAVGAFQDDDGGSSRGAVWILFLNLDGTVKNYQKISDTNGGFTGTLANLDKFGNSVSSLGDLDDDGVTDLVVSSVYDSENGYHRGAVWILFLNTNGTVKAHQKINETHGGFTGALDDEDIFRAVASLGDLDGDGVEDIAVGAELDDDGGTNRGAVWILFLHTDGTVKSHQKISSTIGNFTGTLDDDDRFGISVSSLGDIDGDAIEDIVVGAWLDDDGINGGGAAWILFLNADGTVKDHQKISMTAGNFIEHPGIYTKFGVSVTSIGDLDGDGKTDLIVGAAADDDGGKDRGALWILFLDEAPILTLIRKIKAVLDHKALALETINAALSEEEEAAVLLDNLLANDQLNSTDINTLLQVQQKIFLATVQEKHSVKDLHKSISRLHEAFDLLGHNFDPITLLPESPQQVHADINGDGIVNATDFAILTTHWLTTTTP